MFARARGRWSLRSWVKTAGDSTPHDQDAADDYMGGQGEFVDSEHEKTCTIVECRWLEKEPYYRGPDIERPGEVKEYAEKQYTDEEFEQKMQNYTHAAPFTKESLLYREIFEKYYPGQGDMIVDFWMPNKEWEGCNVNDPSARVLSNYGASGK